MRYVQVLNGSVGRVYTGPLGWINDDGTTLTDEEYRVDHSIYPLVDDHPNDDTFLEMPSSDWIVSDVNVTATYWSIIDNRPDEWRISKNVIRLDESQWVYDISALTARVVYDIVNRTDEEIAEVISNSDSLSPDEDSKIYQVKPANQWMYDGIKYSKTYWLIVPDPNRETQSDVLYIATPTDRSTWVSSDAEIFEVCAFTEKDITTIKSSLKAYIADYRWKVEVGGMMFGDYQISTDRESQSKILAKYTYIKSNVITDENISWKTVDGFIAFAIIDFDSMCIGVENFVSTAYKNELWLVAEIEDKNTFVEMVDIHSRVPEALSVDGSVYVMEL